MVHKLAVKTNYNVDFSKWREETKLTTTSQMRL